MLDKDKHQLYCDLKVLVEKYWLLKEHVRYEDFVKALAKTLGI